MTQPKGTWPIRGIGSPPTDIYIDIDGTEWYAFTTYREVLKGEWKTVRTIACAQAAIDLLDKIMADGYTNENISAASELVRWAGCDEPVRDDVVYFEGWNGD